MPCNPTSKYSHWELGPLVIFVAFIALLSLLISSTILLWPVISDHPAVIRLQTKMMMLLSTQLRTQMAQEAADAGVTLDTPNPPFRVNTPEVTGDNPNRSSNALDGGDGGVAEPGNSKGKPCSPCRGRKSGNSLRRMLAFIVRLFRWWRVSRVPIRMFVENMQVIQARVPARARRPAAPAAVGHL